MKPRANEPAPSTIGPDSGLPIVLKKYGNRRLYDTRASRYVTLPEVEEMVQRGNDVQVVDAKSGDDLTKEVLVQIILDKDGAREMLPTSFLKQVVRLSSSPLKESFTHALQGSLDTFLQGQRALADAQRGFLQQLPYSAWNPFAAFAGPRAQAPVAPAAPAVPSAEAAELERLRGEVSQTQALLRQLLQGQPAQQAAGGAVEGRGGAGRKPKRARAGARG